MFRLDKVNNDYPTLQKTLYINLVNVGILCREIFIIERETQKMTAENAIEISKMLNKASQFHFGRDAQVLTDVLNHITTYKMCNYVTDLNNNVANCDSSYLDYFHTLITAYTYYHKDDVRVNIIKNAIMSFIGSVKEIYGRH